MALLPDQKFSTFQDGGDLQEADTIVGLRGGINTKFNYPGAIPPGTVIGVDEGGTGADNPTDARTNLGLGTISTQDADNVAITGGTAALDNASVSAAPSNPDDVVNKAYADAIQALLANYLLLSGGTMTGAINMGNSKISSLATPTVGTDAVTKDYVDQTALNGTSVYAATTTNLTVTQAGAGVGATLTNAGTQAVFAIDGVSPPVGSNVLIKNLANAANQGIYTVTNVGSASTNWILTRATSYDTAVEINNTGLIIVRNGTTLAGTAWYNSTTIVTVDTTAFSYASFGLTIPVSVSNGGTGKTSVTLNNLLLGNGTSALNELTPGTGVLTAMQSAVNTSSGFATTALTGTSGNFAKNLIVGGDFGTNPWQRGTTFISPLTTNYLADRWFYGMSGASTALTTITQSSDAPTVAQAGIYTANSLLSTITSADTSITTGKLVQLSQAIEGYNFTRIAQRPFTISFWVKASVTGVYCVGLRNSGSDRSYVAEYTINSANTWEFKSITVSASPSAGTWNYTNGVGLYLSFVLAAGSSFQTTSNTWQTGNFLATSNQINAVGTVGNTFQLALVQVEPGSVATPFEIRTIDRELSMCQRYFYKTFVQGVAPAQSAGSGGSYVYSCLIAGATRYSAFLQFPVSMRTTPTATYYSTASTNATWRNLSGSADSGVAGSISIGYNSVTITNPQVAGDAVSNTMAVQATFSAEL